MAREAVLILEDSDEKIQNILYRYKDTVSNKPIYIARNVAQAQAFIESDPGLLWVFLDQDLGPGNGTGTGFLAWLLEKAPHFLQHVVAISFSMEARREWKRMCDAAKIPIQSM